MCLNQGKCTQRKNSLHLHKRDYPAVLLPELYSDSLLVKTNGIQQKQKKKCFIVLPFIMLLFLYRGRRVIGISRSLIWSKTLMELIFNPCGEFWWSPEGPVSQIHSPQLHIGAPGIFSDLLRFVQMLKREWGTESNRKLLQLFIPSKIATWFLSLQWKTCLWAELKPWSLLWFGQKPWWNWYLTPVVNFGEVQRAQLAKSTLFTSMFVPLGSFKVCSDAKERVGYGNQWEATAPIHP